MQKHPLGATARIIAVFAVLACSVVPARAGYFDDVYACDDTYYGTLSDCRSGSGYPYSPTESQCRYNAGDSYVSCLNSIFTPMPQMDFCTEARQARDNCNAQYSGSGLEYWSAYSACIDASGINQCE